MQLNTDKKYKLKVTKVSAAAIEMITRSLEPSKEIKKENKLIIAVYDTAESKVTFLLNG